MRDGTGLSEATRSELKTVYHHHHESVSSFWGVYELLTSSVGLSVSPPLLSTMLRSLGVELFGAPRSTRTSTLVSEHEDGSIPAAEQPSRRSSTLLLHHLFCIVEEVTDGHYADAFGDDDLLLLQLALQNENLAPPSNCGEAKHVSTSLIQSLIPASVCSRLSNFVSIPSDSSGATAPTSVVDVDGAWKFISSLRSSRRNQSHVFARNNELTDSDRKEVASVLPADCLTKDMAKLFNRVSHSDGGLSSETTSQQTGGAMKSQGLPELSSSPLKSVVSKTSMLRIRKSFSHALDFSKPSHASPNSDAPEGRPDGTSPMSPSFSDSGDESGAGQFPTMSALEAVPPATLIPREMTFAHAAAEAENILQHVNQLQGSVSLVIPPEELERVEHSLGDVDRKRNALLVRHESVQDMFEHRKRTTRLSSITFANSGAFGERRTSLVSFDTEALPVDHVDDVQPDRWKRLRRSLGEIRKGHIGSDDLVSHRSFATNDGGESSASSSCHTSTSGFTSYFSEKSSATLSKHEKLLLQSKRVTRVTLDREIFALDPICCGYLDRAVAQSITRKQATMSNERARGSSALQKPRISKNQTPPLPAHLASPAHFACVSPTTSHSSPSLMPDISRPSTPHWGRWTTGGR